MTTPRDRLEARLGLAGPPLQPVRDTPPRIADHELIRRIGQGAYGEVWLARNALGTWRAVKIVFRDNFKDARPYEREFAGIRRFEPLSRSNEGFVDVLQVGRDDAGGWFYYVMELADCVDNPKPEIRTPQEIPNPKSEDSSAGGEVRAPDSGLPSDFDPRNSDLYQPHTLARDLHHRGRLPLEDCLELGLTLTLALGHLHRHGLIHRDVKPSNIIFVGGVPKLADIGLVTEAQGANTFVGTEGFVPPEGPTSPQADLYALGKVLYEAAMGKDRNEFPEPFTQIGTDRESIALMELNAVLLRACAPDPRQRYASAEAMHADLALLHSGGSVKRRHQFDRQFQIAKQVGAVAIAVTVLVGAALLWQRQQTQKMTRLAEEKSTLATEKSKLADDLTRLDAENRNRIVRLDIANGVRLLDEGDPAGALLCFADALPLLTNNPAQESIHRIRIQQTLNQLSHPVHVLAEDAAVRMISFSPDGRWLAAVTDSGWVYLWDARTGALLHPAIRSPGEDIRSVAFTSDGESLLLCVVSGPPAPSSQWSFVNIEARSGQTRFSTVLSNLTAAHFFADGRWLATSGTNPVIRVTSVEDGREKAVLRGHTGSIQSLISSEKGDLLASVSEDRTIRVWRLPSGEPVGEPIRYEDESRFTIAFSRDGQRLLVNEAIRRNETLTNVFRVWSTDTMERIGEPKWFSGMRGTVRLVGHTNGWRILNTFGGQIRILDADTQAELLGPIPIPKGEKTLFHDETVDGRLLVVADRDGVEGVWNLVTGELIVRPFRLGLKIRDVWFNHDGSQLAIITTDTGLLVWNLGVSEAEIPLTVTGKLSPQKRQNLLEAFSPDRTRHVLLPTGGPVQLLDVDRMTVRNLPRPESSGLEPCEVRFGHARNQWAIACVSRNSVHEAYVELWRDEAGNLKRLVLPHPLEASRRSFNSDREIRAAYRWEDGGLLDWFSPPWYVIRSARFSPGAASFVTICRDGQIRQWRTADGALERSVQLPENLESAELFPDARTILAWDKSEGYMLYDWVSGSKQPTVSNPGSLSAIAFDPSGDRFATVSRQGLGRVWSAKTGAALSPPLRSEEVLCSATWSADGRQLALAGHSPEVLVRDVSTGELTLPPLLLGNDALQAAAWSLDGRFLVARSDEKMVRVWDATTGEPVTPILKHRGFVTVAQVAANNRLVTLSLPNQIRAWDLAETRLSAQVIADYAKLVSGRRLSRDATMQPLKPSELAELCRALRARAPDLFP